MKYFKKDVDIDGKLFEDAYHRVVKISMEHFDKQNMDESMMGSVVSFDSVPRVYVVVNVYPSEKAMENRANSMVNYVVEPDYSDLEDWVYNNIDTLYNSMCDYIIYEMEDVDLFLSLNDASRNFVNLDN